MRGVFADVLGGEAKDAAAYIASLPTARRSRARQRQEERAEAVHRLVLSALAVATLVVVVVGLAVITEVTALTWHAMTTPPPRAGWPTALKVGLPFTALSLGGLTYVSRHWKRMSAPYGDADDRRRREDIGQTDPRSGPSDERSGH
jgi:hypothetical protein